MRRAWRVLVLVAVLAVVSLSLSLLVVPTRAVAAEGDVVWSQPFVASAVAVYGSGVYVAGQTFTGLPGQPSVGGYSDAFVRKYDTAGNVVWTRQFGTNDRDDLGGVAADGSGVYVVGMTLGVFPGQTPSGERDTYVRKYDTAGNVVWTRQFGSGDYTSGYAVAVDSSGVYVAGTTRGALSGQSSFGGDDAFVRQYDTNGNLVWTRQFGTSFGDGASGVATDGSGVYVSGTTMGVFAGQTSLIGADGYVRKYSPSGEVLWTRQFAAPSGTTGYGDAAAGGVAVDGLTSMVYVVGWTTGVFAGQASSGGINDVFMRAYNSGGAALWTRQFGTTGEDWATGAAADGSGAYAIGYTYSDIACWEDCEISAFIRKYEVDGGSGWSDTLQSSTGLGVALDGAALYAVGDTFVRKYELARPLVLFVEGVTSAESCGRPKTDVLNLFGYIKDQVLPDAEFRVFSYRQAGAKYVDCEEEGGVAWPAEGLDSAYDWSAWESSDFGWGEWPSYAASATCGSIDGAGGHSDRFRQWYAQVTEGYDDVFVLAHSMGGVVVANALATWPGGIPANLRGVVTLDSPLQGHPNASLIALKPGKACEATDAAVLDLYPGSSVIQAINPSASVPWRGLVTAIGNNQDLVVGAGMSQLPGAWLNFRINCGAVFGTHSCVFRVNDARGAIAESLLKPFEAGTPRADPTLALCQGQPANVVGSPKSDQGDNNSLYGSPGNDVIAALGGNDWVYGGGGNDRICGGSGIDTLYGEGGRDSLYGQGEGDTLYGGPENDILVGDPASAFGWQDTLYGEDGNDTLTGGPGLDIFDGGLGTDTCDVAGTWELAHTTSC